VAGISSARWWIRRFGAGWGYRLLNHLLADADEVSVDTAEVNAAAIALYHKAGFVLEQRWSVPDGLVLWRMLYQAGRLRPVLHLEPSGWVREARQCRHPIVMPGSMASPELLVIHNISLPPYRYGSQAVEQLFTNSLNPDEDPFFARSASCGCHPISLSGAAVSWCSLSRCSPGLACRGLQLAGARAL
jgi:AmpD protein